MRRAGGRMKLTRTAHSGMRARLLPAVATALLVRVSVASSGDRYDLRALASALGLFVVLAFALAVATLDALGTRAVHLLRELAREIGRTEVRFGPAAPAPALLPPPIREDQLLDKRGRPLRGAARAARLAALERPRAAQVAAAQAAQAARAAAAGRVIRLPALPRIDVSLPRVAFPLPRFSLRAVRAVAITTTMTFVFATVIGTTGLISKQATVALGASTTLTIIGGAVDARASATDEFRPIADGALLRAGMTIRTGPYSYAVLTYFEGSTVSIDPGTTLVIEALEANPDGTTIIAMRQDIGRTWHSVAKLLHQGSKYEVRTPSATAQVRGTMFAVGVEADEQGEVVTTVETTEGAVATAKAPTPQEPQPTQEVLVQPGNQVTVKQSAPLEQPKPAPEPDRKVTVTVGTTTGLVLDPVGRANGIKDGKVIVQTPGATVQTVNGKLVITLPKIPDGKISTVLDPKAAPQEPVEVVTTVKEKGRSEERTEDRVQTSTPVAPAVSAVEVKKGTTTGVTKVTDEQKKDIASSVKVAEAPKVVLEQRKDDASSSDKDKKKDQKGDGPGGPSAGIAGFLPAITLPPLPGGPADLGNAALIVKRVEQAKEEAKKEERKDQTNEQRKQDAPNVETPRVELPKVEATREQPKTDTSKSEQKNDRSDRNEAQRADLSRFVPSLTLPPLPFTTEPAAKRDEPKKDEPKKEEPRAAAPATGAQDSSKPEEKKDEPKKDEPKKDEPKRDEPKKEEKKPEIRGFVPSLTLPPLPLGTETPKREEPKRDEPKKEEPKVTDAPRIELPRIEFPKIDLPIFQPAPEPKRSAEPTDRPKGNDDKVKDKNDQNNRERDRGR